MSKTTDFLLKTFGIKWDVTEGAWVDGCEGEWSDRLVIEQLIERIAAQAPQWSDSTPTEAGWYWWRASPTSRNDPYMRKVYDHKWMMHNDGQPTLTAKVGGQWAKATPPDLKGEGK